MKRFPPVDPSQPINYVSSQAPSNYICGGKNCKNNRKPGLKLWRYYGNFNPDKQLLMCADCSGAEQAIDVTDMTHDGQRFSATVWKYIDQIGDRIPAIPTERNDCFWSYGSAPEGLYGGSGCRCGELRSVLWNLPGRTFLIVNAYG